MKKKDRNWLVADYILHVAIIGGLGIYFMSSNFSPSILPQYLLGISAISGVLLVAEHLLEKLVKG
jgi:hypothetical protein